MGRLGMKDWLMAKDLTRPIIESGIERGLYKLEPGETVAEAVAKSNAVVSTWTRVSATRSVMLGLEIGTAIGVGITGIAVIYGLCKRAQEEREESKKNEERESK